MNKKIIVRIIALVCVLLFCVSIGISSNAAVTADNVKKFSGSDSPTGAEPIQQIIAMVLDVIRLIGAGIAVVMLMTIAAKYMIASSGDRADIKKYALNYVIGAIILFASSGILKVVRDTITK